MGNKIEDLPNWIISFICFGITLLIGNTIKKQMEEDYPKLKGSYWRHIKSKFNSYFIGKERD